MKKPLNLNSETWKFIQNSLKKSPIDSVFVEMVSLGYNLKPGANYEQVQLNIVEDPAPYLLKHGILEMPNLLQNTVVELDDGVEYLIDNEAALAIARSDEYVKLQRIEDKIFFLKPRNQIRVAMQNHCTFDQLD